MSGRKPHPPAGGAGGDSRKKRPREDQDEFEDEEEPEGEDLFGPGYMDDYTRPDDTSDAGGGSDADAVEDVPSEANSFIADSDEDESEGGELDPRQRAEVDRMLEKRRRLEEQLRREKDIKARQKDAVYSDDEGGGDSSSSSGGGADNGGSEDEDRESDEGVAAGAGRGRRRRGVAAALGVGAVAAPTEEDEVYNAGELPGVDFNWMRPQGDLSEWLNQELPRRVIKNRIYNFFLNFTRDNVLHVYEDKAHAMARDNRQTIEVSYLDLAAIYESVLAVWIADVPEIMLDLFEEAANYLVYRTLYPEYKNVHTRIYVRICDLPVYSPIRDFRQGSMGTLVQVEGVVVRRSPIYPQMQAVKYDCIRCSFIIGPVMQRGDKEQKVSQCPSCHSKGPFRVNMALTEYRNHQTLALQEAPGKVPPGRLPRSLEVVVTADLIDRAKPGEEIAVIGVYKNNFDPILNSRQGFPVFTTTLHANNIVRRVAEMAQFRLPSDDKAKILELAKHPNIKKKLIQTVAPSIHGRDEIKLGLLLSLMGGVRKDVGGDQSHRIRGDINVLLVGDPGCAKSQFLKFVEKTSDRGVFTTGRGSTAVGLTASVHKDAVTGDFTLEGGALVVADRGVCLIDEFDKMSDQDRTSIHEAMEQQTISIARGGIVTTLSARCAIIAAANPIGGRYDPSLSFDANVNLTTPILSRFDLLFVVRDEVNPELDLQLAKFICSSHTKNHPVSHAEIAARQRELNERIADLRQRHLDPQTSEEERKAIEPELIQLREEINGDALREDEDPMSSLPLPQQTLRNYLMFAKAHCVPRISNIDENTIARLYTELRQESRHGGIPITVRHMESIIRLSEAHAKLHLREFVKDEDVTAAVALFLRCFLQTQKYSLRHGMEQKFRKYLESDIEPLHLLHHRVKSLVTQTRSFERQVSGGVEPVRVDIDCSLLDDIVASINVSREALAHYYQSDLFTNEYELLRDGGHIPIKITHTLLQS